MRAVWVMLPVLLIPAAFASGQNYQVETTKLLEVFGDVRVWSCGGGCCEGHDSTACVGVQVRDEDDRLLDTAIYDNASCCYAQCRERQRCGPLGFIGISKDGPAESCPSNRTHFSAPVGKLNLCVAPGEVFRVPVRRAKLGNVVNNSWSGGSKCSERDPFEPYGDRDVGSRASWGGFTDTCPDPQNPDLVCVPSDCTPEVGDGRRAVPRYAAEIIEPYGNEYVTRWDDGDVWLQWRPIGLARLDRYRIVVYANGGKIIDERVACPAERCSHQVWFPLGAASYYWWVQPQTATVTGDQSRAGVFNLLPPLPSCAGLGGSCVGSSEPGAPAVCEDGSTVISGALDCPDTCCGPSDPEDTPSCGELGGNYCSPTASCPAGSVSLGTTRLGGAVECQTCCKQNSVTPTPIPGGLSCGEMGGDYCSQSSTCPFGYASLGFSYDCNPCCSQNSAPPTPTPTGLSCGEMGGDYCSQNGTCPGGFSSLGLSYDCNPCCKQNEIAPTPTPALASCGAMGGDHCSQNGTCPGGFSSLGLSYDCNPCCKQNPATPVPTPTPAGQSCGAMGGNYCSQNGTCPNGYNSLGLSNDCNPCCKQKPATPIPTPTPAGQSCGAMGGDYCSQSGSCPGTHDSLGKSYDCNPCCVSKPSCGAMGGDYCAQGGSCPDGFSSLGRSADCNPCCAAQ